MNDEYNIRIVLTAFAEGLIKALEKMGATAGDVKDALDGVFDDFNKGADDASSRMRRTSKDADNLKDSLVKTNQAASALTNALGGLRLILITLIGQPVISGVVALGAALVSVASSATLAAAALGGALAAGIGALIPTVGLLVGAFSQLKKVFEVMKLESQAQTKASTDHTAAMDQQRQAAQRLKDAQVAVLDAQRALAIARRDAKRDIEDLILREKELRIAQERSNRATTERIAALNEAKYGFGQGAFALTGAQLDLQEQKLNNQRSALDSIRNREDLSAELKKGVEGSDRVVQAQRNLERATRDLANAQRDMAKAMQSAGSAADAYQQALDKLTPAQRRVFNAMKQLRDDAKSAFQPITDGILGSFERAIKRIDGLVKDQGLINSFRTLGKALSGSIDLITKSMSSPAAVQNFTRLNEIAAKALPIVAKALDGFGRTLLNIAVAGGPTLLKILRGLADVTQDWAKKTSNLKSLEDFFARGLKHAQAWYGLLKAVGGLLAALVGASADAGKNGIDALTGRIEALTKYLNDNQGAAKNFFQEAMDTVREFGGLIEDVIKAVAKLYAAEPVKEWIAAIKNIIPPLTFILTAFGNMGRILTLIFATPVIGQLASWALGFAGLALAIIKVQTAIKGMFLAFKTSMDGFTKGNVIMLALTVILLLVVQYWDQISAVVKIAYEWVAENFGPALKRIAEIAVDVGKKIASVFMDVVGAVRSVINWVREHWSIALYLNPVTAAIKLIKDHWNDILDFFDTVGNRIKSTFETAWGFVKDIANGTGNAIKASFDGVVGIAEGAVKGIYSAFRFLWNGLRAAWEPIKDSINDVSPLGDLPSIPEMPEWRDNSTSGSEAPRRSNAQAFAQAYAGDYVPAAPGGRRYIVGEGGHDEVILTTDPKFRARTVGLMGRFMRKFADGGLVTKYTPPSFGHAGNYDWAKSVAGLYGLSLASTYRSPKHNESVGGSKTSRHMVWGAAADLSGAPSAMYKTAVWAYNKGRPPFAEIFYDPWGQWDNGRYSRSGIGGHSDHVHLSYGIPFSVAAAGPQFGGSSTLASTRSGDVPAAAASSNSTKKESFAQYWSRLTGRPLSYAPLKYLQPYYYDDWKAIVSDSVSSTSSGGSRTSASGAGTAPVSGTNVPASVAAIAAQYPAVHPKYGGTPRANILLGYQMAKSKGWTGRYFNDLVSLWWNESGWSQRANNSGRHGMPDSHAYGIPQALPPTKMSSAGSDWASNPATQIKWGLDYIAGRSDYGNPSAAWAKWQSRTPHWYAGGGLVPGEGEPVPIMAHGGEIVLNAGHQRRLGGRDYLMKKLNLGVGGSSFADGGLVTGGLGAGFGANFSNITSSAFKEFTNVGRDFGRIRPQQFGNATGFATALGKLEEILLQLNNSVKGRIDAISTLVGNQVKRLKYAIGGTGQIVLRDADGSKGAAIELDGLKTQMQLLLGQEGVLRKAFANAQAALKKARTNAERQAARQTIEKIGAAINDVLGAQGDIMDAIFQKQGEVIKNQLDSKLNGIAQQESAVNLASGIAGVRGGSQAGFIQQRTELNKSRLIALTEALGAARAGGQVELANEIQQQINDVQVAIYQGVRDSVQASIDDVNGRRNRADAQLDLTARIISFTGGSLNEVLNQRMQVIRDQIGGLTAQLANAQANGLTDLAQDLVTQIGNLNQDIADIARQQVTNAREAVNKKFSQQMSLNDVALQIAQISGPNFSPDIGAVSGILNQRGALLTARTAQLTEQLRQAQLDKNTDAMNELQLEIEQNKLAILQNSQQLAELNNQSGVAQGFSSLTWQWFRKAIFDGAGSLLPDYIPQMATGGFIKKEGLFYLHAGEKVTPASEVSMGGNSQVVVNINEADANPDPLYMAKRIAFELRGRGAR